MSPELEAASRAQRLSQRNLLEELIALRDRQRASRSKGLWHIRGDDLPWELNRQGYMRWYMHPLLDDVAINTEIFFVQRIPPGSRSGKQKSPGGVVIYVVEGRGYTVLNGVRHAWEAGDVINLPILGEGVVFQHFNADPEHQVVLVCAQANHTDPLGVDGGAEFDQLEPCSEWLESTRAEAAQPVSAERRGADDRA